MTSPWVKGHPNTSEEAQVVGLGSPRGHHPPPSTAPEQKQVLELLYVTIGRRSSKIRAGKGLNIADVALFWIR